MDRISWTAGGRLSRRAWLAGAVAALLPGGRALAAAGLRVGDQKGGARALLDAAQIRPAGVDVQWTLFAGAPMLIQAMSAGAVDVGGLGDAPLVYAQAGQVPVQAIAALQTDGTTTAIVVRHDSPVRDVAGLKGRRVATLKSQTGHYLTLAALRAAGLKDDDVEFVFIAPVAAKLALQTGAVDAWATWGPYISDAKVDGAREIVNGGRLMSGLSYVVATRAAIADRRAGLVAYLRALRTADAWLQTHGDAYAQSWAQTVGLPLAVARDVVPGMTGRLLPLDGAIAARQQHVADFMFETRMIPQHVDVGGIFARDFSF